jgi:hypothetical protein
MGLDVRVWNPISRTMVYNLATVNINNNVAGEIHNGKITAEYMDRELKWFNAEVMLDSTLTDMDGKKIFKDDIIFIYDDVKTESGWWENVIFHHGCFMAGEDNLLVNVHFRSRVIGNKYEGTKLSGNIR